MTAYDFIKTKRAIIFDLFHTLTSLESITSGGGPMTSEMLGVTKEAWNEQLLEKSRDRLTGKDKDPYSIIEKMAHALNPDIPAETIRRVSQIRMRRFEETLVNIPENTVHTIRRLKETGKKIGLLSNADVAEICGWKKSPVAWYFDSVIFSCDAGFAKPDREIYNISLRGLGVRADQAVFVGDGGSNELWGAKQAGLSTVMITGVIRKIWPDRIEAGRADSDYEIVNIDELID